MPVFHYFGADALSLREACDRLRRDHDGDGALANNTLVLEGPRTTPEEVAAAAMTVPFMADYRLVRVDDLCRPYNPPRGAAAARRRRERLPDEWAALPEMLGSLPPSTVLVFVDGEVGGGNPMKQVLGQVAKVEEFKPARGGKLVGWVNKRARDRSVNLSPRAARALIDWVGEDQGALASEIDKLRLYAGGAAVDEEAIRRVCPRNFDAEIWDLTDAVGEGRPEAALRALETLRADGRPSAALLGALANQMRRIIVAREIIDGGGDAAAVKQHFRIGHPYPAQKLTEQARRFPPARAAAAPRRIRDCDAAVQRFRRDLPGGLSDEVALELLVVDLAGG